MLYLNELEEILELVRSEHITQIQTDLYKLISDCINSEHFQVTERALFFWNSERLCANVLSQNRAAVFLPHVFGPLTKVIHTLYIHPYCLLFLPLFSHPLFSHPYFLTPYFYYPHSFLYPYSPVLPLFLYPYFLTKVAQGHWNQTVEGLAQSVLKMLVFYVVCILYISVYACIY